MSTEEAAKTPNIEPANYRTVEVKTEEEIEQERRDYIERTELENKEKAINAKAKRNKADRIYIKTLVGVLVLTMAILLVRWFLQ